MKNKFFLLSCLILAISMTACSKSPKETTPPTNSQEVHPMEYDASAHIIERWKTACITRHTKMSETS